MAALSHLIYSPLSSSSSSSTTRLPRLHLHPHYFSLSSSSPFSSFSSSSPHPHLNSPLCFSSVTSHGASGSGAGGGYNSGGGNGGGGGGGGDNSGAPSDPSSTFGILGLFIKGWQSRVAADPQFPFKVLMEELVGVTACVIGDMASRPNFGLNELDFVFSTLVVGSILNFTLMYLLAPTAGAGTAAALTLPSIFASCPTSHMFEPGPFSPIHRCGTFVYKGLLFATVGFFAGLAGTALSNGLIMMRKKMDPTFETPNKAPPTLLNSFTWALHMGLSSNFRYQTLNGLEFVLANSLPPLVFKTSVVALRCANNVLGGMSFVVLARLTGSQSVEGGKTRDVVGVLDENEKVKVLENQGQGLASNQST